MHCRLVHCTPVGAVRSLPRVAFAKRVSISSIDYVWRTHLPEGGLITSYEPNDQLRAPIEVESDTYDRIHRARDVVVREILP